MAPTVGNVLSVRESEYSGFYYVKNITRKHLGLKTFSVRIMDVVCGVNLWLLSRKNHPKLFPIYFFLYPKRVIFAS